MEEPQVTESKDSLYGFFDENPAKIDKHESERCQNLNEDLSEVISSVINLHVEVDSEDESACDLSKKNVSESPEFIQNEYDNGLGSPYVQEILVLRRKSADEENCGKVNKNQDVNNVNSTNYIQVSDCPDLEACAGSSENLHINLSCRADIPDDNETCSWRSGSSASDTHISARRSKSLPPENKDNVPKYARSACDRQDSQNTIDQKRTSTSSASGNKTPSDKHQNSAGDQEYPNLEFPSCGSDHNIQSPVSQYSTNYQKACSVRSQSNTSNQLNRSSRSKSNDITLSNRHTPKTEQTVPLMSEAGTKIGRDSDGKEIMENRDKSIDVKPSINKCKLKERNGNVDSADCSSDLKFVIKNEYIGGKNSTSLAKPKKNEIDKDLLKASSNGAKQKRTVCRNRDFHYNNLPQKENNTLENLRSTKAALKGKRKLTRPDGGIPKSENNNSKSRQTAGHKRKQKGYSRNNAFNRDISWPQKNRTFSNLKLDYSTNQPSNTDTDSSNEKLLNVDVLKVHTGSKPDEDDFESGSIVSGESKSLPDNFQTGRKFRKGFKENSYFTRSPYHNSQFSAFRSRPGISQLSLPNIDSSKPVQLTRPETYVLHKREDDKTYSVTDSDTVTRPISFDSSRFTKSKIPRYVQINNREVTKASTGQINTIKKRPMVPVALKAEALYRDGQLEVSVMDDHCPESESLNVKITLVHKYIKTTHKDNKFGNPFAYNKRKLKPLFNKVLDRDIVKHRAMWPPMNTHVNDEASKRHRQFYFDHE